MKKIIRQSSWETNSSSSHSLIISGKQSIFDTIVPNEDNVIQIRTSEYKYESEFNTPILKLIYLYIAITQQNFGDKQSLKVIKQVIKQHTGAKYVIFEEDKDYVYIEDMGDLPLVLNDKSWIKNFIFAKNWTVQVEDRDVKWRRENGGY